MEVFWPDESFAQEYRWLVRSIRNMRGAGKAKVSVTSEGIAIYVPDDDSGRRNRTPQKTSPEIGDCVEVIITSNASGGGKYNGKILLDPAAEVSASGDVSAADFGEAPADDNALIINTREEGLASTHYLTDANNIDQPIWGGKIIQVKDDGTFVVAIDGFFYGGC